MEINLESGSLVPLVWQGEWNFIYRFCIVSLYHDMYQLFADICYILVTFITVVGSYRVSLFQKSKSDESVCYIIILTLDIALENKLSLISNALQASRKSVWYFEEG